MTPAQVPTGYPRRNHPVWIAFEADRSCRKRPGNRPLFAFGASRHPALRAALSRREREKIQAVE